MPRWKNITSWLCAVNVREPVSKLLFSSANYECVLKSVLGMGLIVSSGCQTWHSSSALPGLKSKQGERQVLREAKNDPFPSPSEVGMKGTK